MNQYIAAHYKVRAKPAFILSSPDCDWERRSSRPLTSFRRRRRRCCTSFRRVFLVFFISSPFFYHLHLLLANTLKTVLC